jgi:reductive dehalogenase
MNFWFIAGEISFIVLFLFFLFFSLASLREKEKKAFIRSTILLLGLLVINFVFLLLKESLRSWMFGGLFILFLLGISLLLFFPVSKKSIQIVGEQKKIDERDVIFARFDYQEGTEVFEKYYLRRPEYKEIDDEIRKIPDILSSPHMKKSPLLFSLASAEFDFLENQITQVDGKKSTEKIELSLLANTHVIKKVIRYLGSDCCGIAPLNQAYVYSHRGRGPEPYGQEISLKHEYAVVFALEMDFEMVASSPQAPVIVETGKKYIEAARISIIVADFIRRLGYSARAHVAGSNYQAVLPPIAWEAGLGELGRLGTLITWKYGSRARLGLVTTDLPLVAGKPKIYGIQNFCQNCQKCAQNCPAQAIPFREKTEENGVIKWALKREECYKFWRKIGTDCAVCMFVCPYSKPDNRFHNLIRKCTTHSSVFQDFSIWGDDFFYGRSPSRRKKIPLGI